jgi:hypothetical protein
MVIKWSLGYELEFSSWNFEFVWNLEFGIWNLEFGIKPLNYAL